MAWTTPRTWAAGELVTAALLNTHVRDNLLHLFGRPYGFVLYTPAANYTRTSAVFADVDATNLSLSVTTAAARLLCMACFQGYDAAGTGAYFDIAVDGTRIGNSTYGLGRAVNYLAMMTIFGVSSVLTAGTHTVRLQYAHASSGTAQIIAPLPITLFALEING